MAKGVSFTKGGLFWPGWGGGPQPPLRRALRLRQSPARDPSFLSNRGQCLAGRERGRLSFLAVGGIGGAAGTRFHAVGLGQAISAVYTARRGVICRNTLFRRRRLRIRGPGSARDPTWGTAAQSPLCQDPIDAVGPAENLHILCLNLTLPVSADPHPNAMQYSARTPECALSSPIREVCPWELPPPKRIPRGSLEIARRRENALPPRSRTRLLGALSRVQPINRMRLTETSPPTPSRVSALATPVPMNGPGAVL